MRKILFALFIASPVLAQVQAHELHVVMPNGTGAIVIPLGGDWRPRKLFLYDNGTRPVIQLESKEPGLELSYILFANGSGAPTAESCREDVIRPLLERFSNEIAKKSIARGETTMADGTHLVTASYILSAPVGIVSNATGIQLQQQNLFGLYGDKSICAEVHLSRMSNKNDKTPQPELKIPSFSVQPAYMPTVGDYAALASVLYQTMKDYPSAAIYYERAHKILPTPADSHQRDFSRFLTDQLAMSYGMSGDIKRSRAINEAAILKDPDYPLYYYNLACADAESNDTTAARTHLQQAFDRRANTIPGEHLPDPTKDDSILKLNKDKAFWAFVEALPKN